MGLAACILNAAIIPVLVSSLLNGLRAFWAPVLETFWSYRPTVLREELASFGPACERYPGFAHVEVVAYHNDYIVRVSGR
jgi:hypothetical protein